VLPIAHGSVPIISYGILESRDFAPKRITFTQQFLEETGRILKKIDTEAVDRLVALLATTRGVGGRLFILGMGGSAGGRLKASVGPNCRERTCPLAIRTFLRIF
jgi:hypothetical protein